MNKKEALALIAEIENFTSFEGPELHDLLDTIKKADSAVFLGYCLQVAQMNGRQRCWQNIQKLAKAGEENS